MPTSKYPPEAYQSPAKATVVPSPMDGSGCTAFVHHNSDDSKTSGLTPGETRKMVLSDKVGTHHVNLKSPGDSLYTTESDFYTATTFDAKYKALLLTMTNLKRRIDSDYLKSKKRDQRHYTATFLGIQKCLHMLQEMVNLSEEVKTYDFLKRLNRAILHEDSLYNPIDMLPCYQDRHYSTYDKSKVDSAYEQCTPLTKASILAVTVNRKVLTQIGIPVCGVPLTPPPRRAAISIDVPFLDDSLLAAALNSDSSIMSSLSTDSLNTTSSTNSSSSSSSSDSSQSSASTQKKRAISMFIDVTPDEFDETSTSQASSSSLGSGFKSFAFSPPPSAKKTPLSAKRRKIGIFSSDSEDEKETGNRYTPPI
ncbi:MAG: hypothetical protein K0U37_05440 [Gammaproteobacteria bacterium]|nr:hypothetical protein [Gammaproteobacteria bacterium]